MYGRLGKLEPVLAKSRLSCRMPEEVMETQPSVTTQHVTVDDVTDHRRRFSDICCLPHSIIYY